MKDITRRGFAFLFNQLGRDYSRQFKHLRQTYITSEDRFLRRGASMQHSNYKTTLKHYIDQKKVAKEMVQYGFRVFPPRPNEMIKRTLRKDTPNIKKDPAILQGLDYQSGANGN